MQECGQPREKEINENLADKQLVLKWLVKNNVSTVNAVGKVIADYYNDEDSVVDAVRKNKKPEAILGDRLTKELKEHLARLAATSLGTASK